MMKQWLSLSDYVSRRGHSDAEIEAGFAAYDKDGDKVLTEDEQKALANDLERERMDLDEEIKETESAQQKARARAKSAMKRRRSSAHGELSDTTGISAAEFAVLTRRVDRLEHSIGSVMSKIDAVLVKIHTFNVQQQLRHLASKDKVLI